jgi:hypothetical protein
VCAFRCDGEGDDDGSDGSSSSDSVPLSPEAMLELLSHRQRREIVTYLVDTPERVATLEEVVAHLVAREAERDSDPPDPHRLVTRLVHVHLPKLADAQMVEYDRRSGAIRCRLHPRLERWLELLRAEESD